MVEMMRITSGEAPRARAWGQGAKERRTQAAGFTTHTRGCFTLARLTLPSPPKQQ